VIAVRRSIAIFLVVGLLLVGSLATAGGASAGAAAPTTTCGNSVLNVGGKGLICRITVVNTIRGTGGSSRVTVLECQGSAGVPAPCTTTVTNLTKLVTSVNQCNGSVSGGGGTLRCSVAVTNRFVGRSTGATNATVNQCVGSSQGGGINIICDPTPASTTNATITQCNGSANGGGLRAGSTCTATGTKPSSHGVRINQCNGSANGGGALIVCSASIRNIRVAVAAPSSGSSGGSNAGATPTATDTQPMTDVGAPAILPVVLAAIFSLAFIAGLAGVAGRRSLRGVRNR
jgi:hypothetical protein